MELLRKCSAWHAENPAASGWTSRRAMAGMTGNARPQGKSGAWRAVSKMERRPIQTPPLADRDPFDLTLQPSGARQTGALQLTGTVGDGLRRPITPWTRCISPVELAQGQEDNANERPLSDHWLRLRMTNFGREADCPVCRTRTTVPVRSGRSRRNRRLTGVGSPAAVSLACREDPTSNIQATLTSSRNVPLVNNPVLAFRASLEPAVHLRLNRRIEPFCDPCPIGERKV